MSTLGTPTFVIVQQDVPGMIAKITQLFSQADVNIGTMTVTRESKGEKAIMIIETDERRDDFLAEIQQMDAVYSASYFE